MGDLVEPSKDRKKNRRKKWCQQRLDNPGADGGRGQWMIGHDPRRRKMVDMKDEG